MALNAVARVPEGDDVLVIDGAVLRSSVHGWSLTLDHILVAVCFVASEALSPGEGTPFRSAAVAHLAVAVDAFGALHAVDASAGTLLFSLPREGKPVDLAVGPRALALATESAIVLWRDGKREERKISATALAFAPEGGLAFASANGIWLEDAPIELAELPGEVVALAPRPGATWLAAGERGVFAQEGALVDGVVKRMAVDANRIAVQRSDTLIAVYDLPHATPLKRIHYDDHAICGLLLAGDLVVGLDGAQVQRIDLKSGATSGTIRATVEDVRTKPETYISGPRIGNRRGVVAIIPVATAAALGLWTYVHRPPPQPARHHLPPPKVAVACDAGCEDSRLSDLVSDCFTAGASVGCIDAARNIREAFGRRQCVSARIQLDELADKLKASAAPAKDVNPVLDSLARAEDGMLTTCR